MFVKNSNSIKRDTISVNEYQKKYLMDNGYYPVSKDKNGWVYLANRTILDSLKKCKGGETLFG